MPPPSRASMLSRKPSNTSLKPSNTILKPTNTSVLPKGVLTRSRQSLTLGENRVLGKRKAESPLKKTTKRSAFGDITNAIGKSAAESKKALKNVTNTTKPLNVLKDTKAALKKEVPKNAVRRSSSIPLQQRKSKVPAPSAAAARPKPKDPTPPVEVIEPRKTRLSARLSLNTDSSDNSLYVSALEDIPDDNVGPAAQSDSNQEKIVAHLLPPRRQVPAGVCDFDDENADDPLQVSDYVMDIFEYLKNREELYRIDDYMEKQIYLNRWMRALLIDWMVEVQENFELNHETLYLAVKIVDIYLSRVIIAKEKLQLVAAAAMFISSKFDERVPPLIEDLIYVCDGAYTHDELIKMEVSILREINFDLSMPLSYRFLRRYARCAKIAMPQLTLARYILELSLMDYSTVCMSESKLAAAALLLALKMQNLGGWSPTLEYFSGYMLKDIEDICKMLNEMLHKKPKTSLATVRNKYSHKVFFEVAKIPLITLDF